MHNIEPFYNWSEYYSAAEDPKSPFYEREYSEFEFTNTIYNYYIHPQWDAFGSKTMYMKILFADYEQGFAIFEFIGEWNDAIGNDIMFLKREVVDMLIEEGISKFILIGENVLNFHSSDDSYYEEWWEDVKDSDGWIAALNFREHVEREMKQVHLDHFIISRDELYDVPWRRFAPQHLFDFVQNSIGRRLK